METHRPPQESYIRQRSPVRVKSYARDMGETWSQVFSVHSIPSANRWRNRTSQPRIGAVSPRILQFPSRQLGRSTPVYRVCPQCTSPQCNGEVPVWSLVRVSPQIQPPSQVYHNHSQRRRTVANYKPSIVRSYGRPRSSLRYHEVYQTQYAISCVPNWRSSLARRNQHPHHTPKGQIGPLTTWPL